MSEAPLSEGYRAAFAEAEALIEAAAPDEATRAEGQAYIARLFAMALDRAFRPQGNVIGGLYYAPNPIGGANSDYRMGQAIIDPKGRYRLSGEIHGAARISFGLYTPGPDLALQIDSYATLDDAEVTDGRFTIMIDPVAGPLRAKPSSMLLMSRALHVRSTDHQAQVKLTRLDPIDTAPVAPIVADAVVMGYARATGQAMAILRQFLRWSRIISAAPNVITQLAPELDNVVQGDPNTYYFSGCFDLGVGEALEVHLPQIACDYWAIEALNHWLEPIAIRHFNNATAHADEDGSIRIVIGPDQRPEGNWIDTGGRSKGLFLYRVVGAAARILPEVKLLRR